MSAARAGVWAGLGCPACQWAWPETIWPAMGLEAATRLPETLDRRQTERSSMRCLARQPPSSIGYPVHPACAHAVRRAHKHARAARLPRPTVRTWRRGRPRTQLPTSPRASVA